MSGLEMNNSGARRSAGGRFGQAIRGTNHRQDCGVFAMGLFGNEEEIDKGEGQCDRRHRDEITNLTGMGMVAFFMVVVKQIHAATGHSQKRQRDQQEPCPLKRKRFLPVRIATHTYIIVTYLPGKTRKFATTHGEQRLYANTEVPRMVTIPPAFGYACG